MGVSISRNTAFRLLAGTIAIALAGLLTSCSSTKMEYAKQVEMDAYPGPNTQGINRYIKENSVGSRLHGGFIVSKLEHTGVDGVENKDEWDSIDVDSKYRITYLPVYGSIDKFAKGDLLTMSIGFGIYHGIYASSSVGINTKYFELGVSSFQRFTYQIINYLGYAKEDDGTFTTLEDFGNENRLVFQYGAGAYASLFIGNVTLSYNGNIYRPNKSIIIDKPIPQFKFATPYLFTNNFLVSYWYNPTTEFQLGITNILLNFNGGHWSLNAGISLWSF
ncbi:MAG: hypothetical protein IKZ45_07855 [Fibrobacter sp.]|nr:hypothetical protein [Fibrobacter sp.]